MGEKDNISYLGHWRDSSILVRGQTVLVICVPPLWLQVLVLCKTSFPWARYWGGGLFQMIQGHYIYCALYFYYGYISSTSDHQALDPRCWGPLIYGVQRIALLDTLPMSMLLLLSHFSRVRLCATP